MPKYVKLIILNEDGEVLSHIYKGQLDIPTVRVRGGNPLRVAEKYSRKFGIHPRNMVMAGISSDTWHYSVVFTPAEYPKEYEWHESNDFSDDTVRQRIATAIKKRKKS